MDSKPDSIKDIEKIAINILKDSRTYGILPTPVDKIVEYTELKINQNIDLGSIHPSFLSKAFNILVEAKRKLMGVLDFGNKEIYLDLNQNVNKNRFIKLHEVGHNSLPWQKEIFKFFLDDKHTLDPDTKEMFENEASFFASSTLFQLHIFDDESKKLPLSILSAMYLAKKFGASMHASIRRYVENSNKRCALLVLEIDSKSKINIRNYFQSDPFTNEYGDLNFIDSINNRTPFIEDINLFKKFHVNGLFNFKDKFNKNIKLNYHFFHNSYNYFIFLFPHGELIKSPKKLIVKQDTVPISI